MTSNKPYIIQHSFADLIQGARLDLFSETEREIVLNVQGFQTLSSKLFEKEGKIYERAKANYVPLKLTFLGISELKRDAFFTSLEDYCLDDPSRTIAYMFSWRPRIKRDGFYMFGLRPPADADIEFYARSVHAEKPPGSAKIFAVERNWSPAPPMPDRLSGGLGEP